MEKQPNRPGQRNAAVVWDCGSTLYDSFELESLRQQLDSAISTRSLSMPHLSGDNHRARSHQTRYKTEEPATLTTKAPSRVSRSLLKLLRSVFKTRRACASSSSVRTCSSYVGRGDEQSKLGQECYRAEKVLAVDDKRSFLLATIPEEAPEAGESPEISAFVRRTVSERFKGKLIGISCA